MADCLQTFYDVCVSEGQFLTPHANNIISPLGRKLLVMYNALASEAAAKCKRAWNIVPKFHLFVQLCEMQAPNVGNPRWYWTYADEDMVGRMVDIARSCHATHVAPTAISKSLLLHFEPAHYCPA